MEAYHIMCLPIMLSITHEPTLLNASGRLLLVVRFQFKIDDQDPMMTKHLLYFYDNFAKRKKCADYDCSKQVSRTAAS